MKTQQSQKKRNKNKNTALKKFGIKLTYEHEFKDILNILFLSLSTVNRYVFAIIYWDEHMIFALLSVILYK